MNEAQIEATKKRVKDFTLEEKRAYGRKRTREHRRRKSGKAEADASESRILYWTKNRALLPPQELAAMQAQDSATLDQMWWMEYGHNVPESDEDFLSLEDGVDDLVEFVREFPCPHLGHFHCAQPGMESRIIPADWCSRRFWQDSNLLTALLAEGEATSRYVRLGFLSSVPDWRVIEYLVERKWEWDDAAALVGIRVDQTTQVAYYPVTS